MILLYHKIFHEALTEWWVSVDTFDRQMAALAASDVVTLDNYDPTDPRHVVITFDGVYENVYEYAFPILQKWGYPFELFVTGAYIGSDNTFDSIEPHANFCNISQLETMVQSGGRLQWHTSTHRRLYGLDSYEVQAEVRVPNELQTQFPSPHFQWFAYPHGDHNDEIVDVVRRNFRGALSCNAGNSTDCYQLNRRIVVEDTSLDRTRVTVIVANYNYGAYLQEAMDSVLHQTVSPDEIILIDDASTDGSREIAERYHGLARVVLNEKNLGIVDNFNKAVGLACGDYIAFLGADNRMRCDYVERCKTALDMHLGAVVAYTDMIIFGPRAFELARQVDALEVGKSLAERWPIYRWSFPDSTPETLAELPKRNFIHGSSMYRRDAWEVVGGYVASSGPEDHNLFMRMIAGGGSAVHVPFPLIEYRQHSANQANTVLGFQLEIARLAAQSKILIAGCDSVVAERDAAVSERDAAVSERDAAVSERDAAVSERDYTLELLNSIKSSASWRLTKPLRLTARLVRYGLTNEDRQRIYKALRYRYHSLPMPARAKKMISFAYHRVIHKAIRSLRRNTMSIAPFHAPLISLVAQQYDMPDYIIWGVIDWHFRHQRPQQLAQALALTGRRIFYISPILVDDERAGFDVEGLGATNQLFQINLFAKGAQSIYSDAPGLDTVAQLRQSIGEVLNWADSKQIVSLVDHPFWFDIASVLPNSRLIYDCMDHHEGFGNNAASLLQLEKSLISEANLTITTSAWLDEEIAPQSTRRALIRNACDFEHFSQIPDSIYSDPEGRRIIGYYGAIAEWFDLDLVEAIAKHHPECSVLLIGADTINAKKRLSKLPNVEFTGEIPYDQLPHYLHSFDVCLLPFKVIPLTLATNPVKVYEYLSAGKPVVSVDLPEMVQFKDLVYSASDKDTFVASVSEVLSRAEPKSLEQKRKTFAEGQTWQHRAESVIEYAESFTYDPKVSVIVVTFDNLDLTHACLKSLDQHSQYERLEIIVVDNASSDGSPAFLSEWVTNGQNRKLILNDDNRGFAAANNQGLKVATGEYLVMLNNDTYVTPGWVRTLVSHLQRESSIGLIGPVTNNIGNEAKIDIHYADMDEMLVKSSRYTHKHIGQTYPLRTAAFFCVMMPRTTYERVGALDEAFGIGFFEDDDYCRRIQQQGLRVVCAEDVFIHHHLSASFDKLKQGVRRKLFEDNKRIYEKKWGAWESHEYR